MKKSSLDIMSALNESFEEEVKELRKQKKAKKETSLKEAEWNLVLDNSLRKAINAEDYDAIIAALKHYNEVIQNSDVEDYIKEEFQKFIDDYELDFEDIEALEVDDPEESIDYILSEFYDLCDNTRVFIELGESEEASKKKLTIDLIKKRLAELKKEEDAKYEEIYATPGFSKKDKKLKEGARNIDKEALAKVTYEDLPDMCYGILPSDNSIIIIKKGERGYYETDFGEVENAEELVDNMNSKMGITPEQRMVMELRSMSGNWEDLKEACKKELKEDEVIEISNVEPELDYVITDVTELEDTSDGDVQAPDIDAMLVMLGESFKEEYGDAIKINILSSSLLENGSFALVDISTPQILKEFEEKNIYDAAVGKNLVLENDGDYYIFKVNSLNGTTRYSKRTKEPIQAIREWVETEFLSEAKKEKEEQLAFMKAKTEEETVKSFVEERPDLKMEMANIEMFIELGKSIKDDGFTKMIQDRMYGLAAEFPNNIEVTNNDDKYELKFNKIDDIVEILFGKDWVKEGTEIPGNEVVGLKEDVISVNGVKFSEKDLKKSWKEELEHDLEDGETLEQRMKEYPFEKWKQDLLDTGDFKLNESYDQFNIGNIDVVYNPQTQECLYSIESADVHDKKINLSKIPSVEVPYDTDTIIKDYIEKQYGPIPQEENGEEKEEITVDVTNQDLAPVPVEDTPEEVDNVETEVVEEAEDDVEEVPTPADMGIDSEPAEETDVEDSSAETGSAYFFKVRPGRAKSGVEDIRQQQKDGVVQQKSSYIVVEEVNLSEADFNEFVEDFSQPKDFLTGVKPLDRKNYAFNVVKVNGDGAPYSVLVDPTGFNYARYVAIQDEV